MINVNVKVENHSLLSENKFFYNSFSLLLILLEQTVMLFKMIPNKFLSLR